MNLVQVGLILNLIGTFLIGLNSFVKLRTIEPNSITVGYGDVGCFWKYSGIVGYPILFIGFLLQYIGS